MFGKIDNKIKKRILQYFKTPDYETWEDIHCIILIGIGTMLTVWQAVIAINPSFPKTGRCVTLEGKIVEDWDRIPTKKELAEAIFYATH